MNKWGNERAYWVQMSPVNTKMKDPYMCVDGGKREHEPREVSSIFPHTSMPSSRARCVGARWHDMPLQQATCNVPLLP